MRNSSRKVWGGSLQPTPASGSRRPRPEGTCLGRRASLALVRGLGQAPLPASWALRALPSAWGLPPALPETLRTPTGPKSACPDDTEEQPCPAGRLAELRVRQGLRALPGQHTRPTRSVAAAQACVWDSLCADHSPGWGAGRAAQMKGRINCPPVLVIPAMDAFWKVLWSRKTPLPRAPPAPGICGSRSTNLPLTLNADARTLHRGASPAASPAFRPGRVDTPQGLLTHSPSLALLRPCSTPWRLTPLTLTQVSPVPTSRWGNPRDVGASLAHSWEPFLLLHPPPPGAEDQHPTGAGVLNAGQGAESV